MTATDPVVTATDPVVTATDPVGELVAGVVAMLARAGQTLAVAESLTGGLLCARVVDVPGASTVLRGGVVAYATDLKVGLLGVDRAALARTGPVDPQVAVAMAQGVRERLAATWGVSTTGVAGPDGGSEKKPVGTVVFARAVRGDDPEKVHADKKQFENNGRGGVRLQAALVALALLMPDADA